MESRVDCIGQFSLLAGNGTFFFPRIENQAQIALIFALECFENVHNMITQTKLMFEQPIDLSLAFVDSCALTTERRLI